MDYLSMFDAITALRQQAYSRLSPSAAATAMSAPFTVDTLNKEPLTRGNLVLAEWVKNVYIVRNGSIVGYIYEWGGSTVLYTIRIPRDSENVDKSKAASLQGTSQS